MIKDKKRERDKEEKRHKHVRILINTGIKGIEARGDTEKWNNRSRQMNINKDKQKMTNGNAYTDTLAIISSSPTQYLVM